MYPCTSCGCCCENIDKLKKSLELVSDEKLKFPYKSVNGVCENFNDERKCDIYENRPLICNVDAVMKYLEVDNENAFYNVNIAACNKMIIEKKLDSKFLIK